jgi:ABC-type dipeptide/oligopeptide/nickel transport system permease subunit
MRGLIGILVLVWLLIGAFAAYQRGYFGGEADVSCKKVSDTALTIVAGPLNYVGVNPKVD